MVGYAPFVAASPQDEFEIPMCVFLSVLWTNRMAGTSVGSKDIAADYV
jgi:hypothetical protein